MKMVIKASRASYIEVQILTRLTSVPCHPTETNMQGSRSDLVAFDTGLAVGQIAAVAGGFELDCQYFLMDWSYIEPLNKLARVILIQ